MLLVRSGREGRDERDHHAADAAASRARRAGLTAALPARRPRSPPSGRAAGRRWPSSAAAWPAWPPRTSSPSAASRSPSTSATRSAARRAASRSPAPPPAGAAPARRARLPLLPRLLPPRPGLDAAHPVPGQRQRRLGQPRRRQRRQVAARRRPPRRLLFGIGPDPQQALTRDGLRRTSSTILEQRGVPPHELAYFVERLLVFLTSCDERRFGQWEHVSWWDFVRAEGKSAAVQEGDRRAG